MSILDIKNIIFSDGYIKDVLSIKDQTTILFVDYDDTEILFVLDNVKTIVKNEELIDCYIEYAEHSENSLVFYTDNTEALKIEFGQMTVGWAN